MARHLETYFFPFAARSSQRPEQQLRQSRLQPPRPSNLHVRENVQRKDSVFLIVGVVMAELGILLIALGGCDASNFETRMPLYICGSITCSIGLLAVAWTEPAPISSGGYLGKFQLNGYLLEAYEQEADKGVIEFRLISSPSVNPAHEAAFIRYMVQEGLIEAMWPEMSSRIEEEASWAFSRNTN
jgi:hypothetical protein